MASVNWDMVEDYCLAYFRTASSCVDYWGTEVNFTHVKDYFRTSKRRFDIVVGEVCRNIPGGSKILEVGAALWGNINCFADDRLQSLRV